MFRSHFLDPGPACKSASQFPAKSACQYVPHLQTPAIHSIQVLQNEQTAEPRKRIQYSLTIV